jgi:hypothetical protein
MASPEEFDDDCGPGQTWPADGFAPPKTCRNMRDFTFEGMAEPGTDLGEAWRDRLRREGKLGSGGSVRDLIQGDQR